jgi:hypothetical protein
MSANGPAIDTKQLGIPMEGCWAHVLTAPPARGAKIRCSMRDRDGYLIEVGQATDLVEGRQREQAPAGRETGRADGR